MKFSTEYPFNQYTLILIYDHWFGIKNREDYGKLGWIKTAELRIENNVVCGGDTVSFYTSDPAMAEPLSEHLRAFRQSIPEDVSITIFEETEYE
jgi:hypothetical protein